MLSRPLLVRRGRALTALVAVVVAASVATATLNLYTDVQAKLHREFRSYGANIVITRERRQLASFRRARTSGCCARHSWHCRTVCLRRRAHCVGCAGGSRRSGFRPGPQAQLLVVGDGLARRPAAALIGKRAYQSLTPKGEPLDLTFQGRALHATPAGILSTGADEDSRVYLSLADFSGWTNLPSSTIEVAVAGSPDEVRAMMGTLASSSARRRSPARPPDCRSRSARVGQDAGHAAGFDRNHHSDRRAVHAGHADSLGPRPA